MPVLKLQHTSLQVFDTPKQKKADARKVFSLGSDIITGTEAGPGRGDVSAAELRKAAKEMGYVLWLPRPQDAWIAINRDLITAKGERLSDKGLIMVIPGAAETGDPNGPYGPKGLPWVRFESRVGTISVGAGHWLTKGRRRNQTPNNRHNHYVWNTRMAQTVGEWAMDEGDGDGIVFYGADVNIHDGKDDPFRGEPLTTCWDELGFYPPTLEGSKTTMDILASYDKDQRVKCLSAKRHTDKVFFMNSDHYTITARYEVKSRRKAA